ncbi:MAG: monooxygenase [Epsilonproteobacteria bacterium]|nr:MAG: monooxygenase [Campylobacterota bacterium]
MGNNTDIVHNNNVGPIVRAGEVALAVAEAAEIDNPDKEVKVLDQTAYLRISCEQEMIIRRETIEECLGKNFEMRELEINMASFAGQIEGTSDWVRFYLEKTI